MYQGKIISLIMPARNEALALPRVLTEIPSEIDQVLIVDNGSTDDTARIGRLCGAKVVSESIAGYGRACLTGIRALEENPPDIVAFADADGSDDLSRLPELLATLVNGQADFVLARRIPSEPDAMSIQQRFGNKLATLLIYMFWGHLYRDLGPMRAIPWGSLKKLRMGDQNYGWTVEMQIRALKSGLRIREHPLPYRRRAAGLSKVSRTISGAMRAGTKILSVIFREAISGTDLPSTLGDTPLREQPK